MSLGFDRIVWTPVLIGAALIAGLARMIVRTPGQVQLDGQLATGAYLGGLLGGALMPWVAGIVAAYGYWIWSKAHRSADFMRETFPPRRNRLMHLVVAFFILLMLLEAVGVAAVRLGLL